MADRPVCISEWGVRGLFVPHVSVDTRDLKCLWVPVRLDREQEWSIPY